ncbi:hypothetical protein [Rhodovulum sp. FJ3]|uniref:hypothetical protein n=1 Tax=Rhodovulum sp. FJ3 TaxID=3079053 RepID=UPI00293DFA92|nr:hypothetical protein [Rhodovulum sp. FJ3]MDV4169279.1 hypothetical protein [Rhodovulum sp. FJ3]
MQIPANSPRSTSFRTSLTRNISTCCPLKAPAGDAFWETYDRIIVVNVLLDGLSRRAIQGGWTVLHNVEFVLAKGLNVWLVLGDETLSAPMAFQPTALLNGVPLTQAKDRSSLHWVLPQGILFWAPTDIGLSLSILQ